MSKTVSVLAASLFAAGMVHVRDKTAAAQSE